MESQEYEASILAVSLIIMGALMILALGLSSSALQSRKSSIGASQSNVAFQAADSGAEIVLQRVRDNSFGTIGNIFPDGVGSCTSGIFEAPGKYKVELKKADDTTAACGDPVSDVATLKSTGYSDQASRSLEVRVNP